MDALVKLVAQKTGISEGQAQTAVTTVVGFLKDKLPAPVFTQIENVIGGGGGPAGIASGLGSLFGKK